MQANMQKDYQAQLDNKANTLSAMLAPYYRDDLDVFASPPQHSRMPSSA